MRVQNELQQVQKEPDLSSKLMKAVDFKFDAVDFELLSFLLFYSVTRGVS